MKLEATAETWNLPKPFIISRGSRVDAKVIVAVLHSGGARGRGEATPYSRYGESIESSLAELGEAARLLEGGSGLEPVLAAMQPGAARNALDCAAWDLRCKQAGRPVTELLGWPPLENRVTAYTIVLGEPREMEQAARENAGRPILKIKTGSRRAVECVEAVRRAAPKSVLLVDANEAWSPEELPGLLDAMAALQVALVEQPLPAANDGSLAGLRRPVPIYADESFHTAADVPACLGKYDGVNIKLDKTGGFSEALRALEAARREKLGVMCGCMLGTSLAMAPAAVVAQRADYVDLDAPLLLSGDRPEGIAYHGSVMEPFGAALWG